MLTHSSNVVPIFPLAQIVSDVRVITDGIERLREEAYVLSTAITQLVNIRFNALARLIETEEMLGLTEAQREPIHAEIRHILGAA